MISSTIAEYRERAQQGSLHAIDLDTLDIYPDHPDVIPAHSYLERMHVLFDDEKRRKELSGERNDSRKHFLKLLGETGSARLYRKPSADSRLDSLYERFPNFADTLDVLSEQIALSSLSENAVFTIRPILLVGPPGVGKTRFMREVAKILGLEFTDISCGGISAGFVLSGNSVSWSDGRPGMVYSTMRDGLTANPVILLDEIDKLSGDSRFSGFGPLYQLLDRESSCHFRDEAVDLEINCSYVSWVATANHVEVIPEAIISRFTVIEVEAPTSEQMVNVIQSIYSDILHDNRDTWGSHFSPEVTDSMIEALQGQGPREIVKMILSAMGRAVKGRKEAVYVLEGLDFKDFKKPVRRIGF